MVQPDPEYHLRESHSDSNRERMQPSDGIYTGYPSCCRANPHRNRVGAADSADSANSSRIALRQDPGLFVILRRRPLKSSRPLIDITNLLQLPADDPSDPMPYPYHPVDQSVDEIASAEEHACDSPSWSPNPKSCKLATMERAAVEDLPGALT